MKHNLLPVIRAGDHVKIYHEGKPLWLQVVGKPGDEEMKCVTLESPRREFSVTMKEIKGHFPMP